MRYIEFRLLPCRHATAPSAVVAFNLSILPRVVLRVGNSCLGGAFAKQLVLNLTILGLRTEIAVQVSFQGFVKQLAPGNVGVDVRRGDRAHRILGAATRREGEQR